MTTTVHFVRHGSHDRLGRILCGRMAGVTLSPQGEAEAAAAASRLASSGVVAVYSSPLERCRQTADHIARPLSCPVETDEGLAEIDFGDWNGAAFDSLAADLRWTAWNENRDATRPPGGESMGESQARVLDFLQRARQAHAGEAIVAVSHCDVIKAALLHGLGLPLQAYGRIEVEPGSISVVALGDWGCKIHSINEVAAWAS